MISPRLRKLRGEALGRLLEAELIGGRYREAVFDWVEFYGILRVARVNMETAAFWIAGWQSLRAGEL
jgi:hypothetical protein